MPTHVQRVQCLNYSAPATCLVDAAGSTVIAANPARKYLCIVNASATVIYLSVGTTPAVKESGIYLAASGGSFEMITANLSNEAVYGITDSGDDKVVTVQEAV